MAAPKKNTSTVFFDEYMFWQGSDAIVIVQMAIVPVSICSQHQRILPFTIALNVGALTSIPAANFRYISFIDSKTNEEKKNSITRGIHQQPLFILLVFFSPSLVVVVDDVFCVYVAYLFTGVPSGGKND